MHCRKKGRDHPPPMSYYYYKATRGKLTRAPSAGYRCTAGAM